MSEKRSGVVGTIASCVAGGFSGWIIPKACDAIFPALATPLSEYPVETIAVSSVCSLIGFGIGWLARGSSQRVTLSERRHIKRRARESQEKNFEEAKRPFYELDPELKAIMLAALEKGASYCNGDDWRFSRCPQNPFIYQFVKTKYIDGDVAEITALPLLEEFRRLVPDAFDGVRSTLERHARDRGARVVSSFSSSSFNWWRYK